MTIQILEILCLFHVRILFDVCFETTQLRQMRFSVQRSQICRKAVFANFSLR